MRRRLCGGLLVAACVALAASGSAAQETGTPMFKAPYRAFTSHEFGALTLRSRVEAVSYALEGFYVTATEPMTSAFGRLGELPT